MHSSQEATRGPDPPPARPSPPPRLTLDWTRNVLGLVVDDEPSAIATFERMLSSVVHDVLTARTAAAALDLALTRQPHVILADVRLQDSDGLDLVSEIRWHGVLARVIVVSGFLDEPTEERAAGLGALAVLSKPVSLEALEAAIDGALRPLAPLGDSWALGLEGTAAERWVSIVLHVLKSPQDPYVREELTRRGAVSLTTLKRICDRVGIEPRDTRDFTRMLGLLVWSRRLRTPVEVLAHASEITLERLAERSGIHGRLETATVREFLDCQHFVSHDSFAFRLLRRALLGTW